MASPNSNSQELHAFADLALSQMKIPDQIPGQINWTNASKPTETTISTRVPEKDHNVKLKSKQPADQERGQPIRPLRFSVSLTKEEIEKDLFVMTGKRPLRWKNKRKKKMNNDLQGLIPGNSLDGQTAETLRKSYGPFSSKRY